MSLRLSQPLGVYQGAVQVVLVAPRWHHCHAATSAFLLLTLSCIHTEKKEKKKPGLEFQELGDGGCPQGVQSSSELGMQRALLGVQIQLFPSQPSGRVPCPPFSQERVRWSHALQVTRKKQIWCIPTLVYSQLIQQEGWVKKEQFCQEVLQNRRVSVDSCVSNEYGSCSAGKTHPHGFVFPLC